VTTHFFDEAYRLIQETDARGTRPIMYTTPRGAGRSADKNGNVTRYTYDGRATC